MIRGWIDYLHLRDKKEDVSISHRIEVIEVKEISELIEQIKTIGESWKRQLETAKANGWKVDSLLENLNDELKLLKEAKSENEKMD